MRNIPPLYHWSPTSVRDSIKQYGLTPSTPHRGREVVCLATSPADAWALSGALRPAIDAWDLWQANVADTPVNRIRHWGRLTEYRIPRVINPTGLVWLASRPGGDCV